MYDQRRWHLGHWIRLGFLVVFAVFVAAMIFYMFNAPTNVITMGPFYWFPFGWIWIFFGFFLFFGLLRWMLFPWGGGYRRWYGYGSYGRQNEAYHILRERYARGEITKDQYDSMMRDLYQQPPQSPPGY